MLKLLKAVSCLVFDETYSRVSSSVRRAQNIYEWDIEILVGFPMNDRESQCLFSFSVE